MALEGKRNTKFGVNLENSYLRINTVFVNHFLDGGWKMNVGYDIFADEISRDEKKDPIETKLLEVRVEPEEIESETNMVALAYKSLKKLQEFNEFKDK